MSERSDEEGPDDAGHETGHEAAGEDVQPAPPIEPLPPIEPPPPIDPAPPIDPTPPPIPSAGNTPPPVPPVPPVPPGQTPPTGAPTPPNRPPGPPVGGPPPAFPPTPPGGPGGFGPAAAPQYFSGGPGQVDNSKATGALVLGILSIVLCWCCYGVPALAAAITALVLGNQSKQEIAASRGVQQGEGKAQAGMICGGVGLGLVAISWIILFVLGVSGTLLEFGT